VSTRAHISTDQNHIDCPSQTGVPLYMWLLGLQSKPTEAAPTLYARACTNHNIECPSQTGVQLYMWLLGLQSKPTEAAPTLCMHANA